MAAIVRLAQGWRLTGFQRAVEHVADARLADGLDPLAGLLADAFVERLGLLELGLGPLQGIGGRAGGSPCGSSGAVAVVVFSSLMARSLRMELRGSSHRRSMQF